MGDDHEQRNSCQSAVRSDFGVSVQWSCALQPCFTALPTKKIGSARFCRHDVYFKRNCALIEITTPVSSALIGCFFATSHCYLTRTVSVFFFFARCKFSFRQSHFLVVSLLQNAYNFCGPKSGTGSQRSAGEPCHKQQLPRRNRRQRRRVSR